MHNHRNYNSGVSDPANLLTKFVFKPWAKVWGRYRYREPTPRTPNQPKSQRVPGCQLGGADLQNTRYRADPRLTGRMTKNNNSITNEDQYKAIGLNKIDPNSKIVPTSSSFNSLCEF